MNRPVVDFLKKYCAIGSASEDDLRFYTVDGTFCSNVELAGLTLALLSEPITCISSDKQ